MKRIVVAVCLAMLCVFSTVLPAFASGDTHNYAFGFTTQCYSETAGFAHAPEYQLHEKQGSCTIIEVRHAVIGNGSDRGYTNYIAAYIPAEGMYVGFKWQAPDMNYHSCTSNTLEAGFNVVPGGRGNTKYYENVGITQVRLEGQFRPH